MATWNKFSQFAENLGKGVHNFTSDATCTITVALCAAANAPIAANSVLADLTEISYTNCSSRVVTGISFEHTTGTAVMAATDLTLTAGGGAIATWRYVVFYDDDPTSPANPLIGWLDYASNVTMAEDETFLIDIPTNLLTLT